MSGHSVRTDHRLESAADKPHHECGVFGVYAPGQESARMAYFGLFALQHRGQESAGIAASDGRRLSRHRGMGLVAQVFDEQRLAGLPGGIAIGHVRYSTTGSSLLANAQPLLSDDASRPMAYCHNGNLVNAAALRDELSAAGERFETSSDTEVIGRLLMRAEGDSLLARVEYAMARVQGAFCVLALTREGLAAFRDPHGFHPLVVGRLPQVGWVVSSESCALTVVGAQLVEEVPPGGIALFEQGQYHLHRPPVPHAPATCVFEHIYFARPDSTIWGQLVHERRLRMGEELAREHPAQADLVVPVPDSGIPAAIGFSQTSGIAFTEGLIKNRYIHRTFIQPLQQMRSLGVRMKLAPLRDELAGKRIVLVDDSIVRGTTSADIIRLVRDAGAREVHLRIASPPYRHPCFYGIDTARRDQLIAARHPDVEAIRRAIGADSLGYLSCEGLQRALEGTASKFCCACFTGEYPIPVEEEARVAKEALETETPQQAAATA